MIVYNYYFNSNSEVLSMIFPSKDRYRLEQLLLPLLQSQNLVSSSTMLRAYVTFASTISYSEDFPLGMLKMDAAHPAFSDACTAFKNYSFDEFLRFIVPDLVGDPLRFLSFLRTNFMSDFSL